MEVSKLKISIIFFLAIVLFGLLYLYYIYNPSNIEIFPKCPFNSLTGLYCPGCGSQRATHQILHGNILEGLKHNFLILILALILGYDIIIKLISIIFKKNIHNILHKSKTTYTILTLVILFWILRNINLFPFNNLAP